MIVHEPIEGRNLVKTYSDAGFLVRQEQTGALYAEAIDVVGTDMTYVETDIPAEDDMTAEEALAIILGGEGV